MRKSIFETIIHSNIKNIWKIITDNEHYLWRSDISEIKILFTEILNIKSPIMEILSYICMNLKTMQKKYIADLIKELKKQKVSST